MKSIFLALFLFATFLHAAPASLVLNETNKSSKSEKQTAKKPTENKQKNLLKTQIKQKFFKGSFLTQNDSKSLRLFAFNTTLFTPLSNASNTTPLDLTPRNTKEFMKMHFGEEDLRQREAKSRQETFYDIKLGGSWSFGIGGEVLRQDFANPLDLEELNTFFKYNKNF